MNSLRARRKRLHFIVLIVGLLIFQEILLRAVFVVPEASGFNRMHYTPVRYFNKDLFHGDEAHASGQVLPGLCNVRIRWESAPDGFAFDHSLNIYGFRGPDFSIAPPTDRTRVLFIGDSFVEGCGASDEETLPRQFERLVSQKPPQRSIEAINLGVAGTGFIEYAELFRDAVPLLKPSTVFLVTCANDLPMPPEVVATKRIAPVIELKSAWTPRLVRIVDRLANHESLPRRTCSGPFPFFEAVPSPTNPLSTREAPANIDPQILSAMKAGKCNPWNLAIASKYATNLQYDFGPRGGVSARLQQFADLCRRHNCRLIVLYVPYHAQVNPIYLAAQNRLGGSPVESLDGQQFRRQQQHLSDACAAAKIPFIDTTEVFIRAEREPNQRFFWPIDGHCNAAGYALLARLCADEYLR